MFDTSSVFERKGKSEISEREYNLTIGLTLLWGFVVNFLMVKYIPVSLITGYGVLGFVGFIVFYFAFSLYGVYLFTHSDRVDLSFLGYNLVVIPFGLIINLAVSRYSPTVVIQSVEVTAAVTLIMMLCGMIFPKFFESIVPVLLLALITVVITELILIFATGASSNWINWVVAIIFSLYIGVDWHRACSIPRTVNNAVDSAAALYIDIINLFVRILGINGSKSK